MVIICRVISFAHAGPSAWNSLPEHLSAVTDAGLFKKQLKIHFSVWLLMSVDDDYDYVIHLCPIIVIGTL